MAHKLTDDDVAWVEGIVRGWARRRQVRDCDADDLVQDVFVRICNGMASRFDPARNKCFRAYISQRLWGLMADSIRKRLGRLPTQRAKRVLDRAMEAAPDPDEHPLEERLCRRADPAERLMSEELKERMLKRLGERSRKIVRLRWKGRTHKEIAREVGVCQSRISQIMQDIRRQLSA